MQLRWIHPTACLVTAAVILTGVDATARQSQPAQLAFEAARKMEVVDRDLRGAIAKYEEVVSRYGSERSVAAQALLRMGICYEQLGEPASQTTFQRILREYADQPAVVAAARPRLVPAGAARQSGDRVVWSGPEIFNDGRVSANGRFISNTDYDTGNLLLRDLVTGRTRVLVDSKGWTVGNPYTSTFSRDSTQLAYGWRTYGDRAHVNEIRILDVAGPDASEPRRVYANEDISTFNPLDWSPDGRWLAVFVQREDLSGQLALIGVLDGSFEGLKTVGWRGPGKAFFSPDGKFLAYDLPPGEEELERDVFILALDHSGESHVKQSGNDVVMGWSPDGRQLFVASDRSGPVGLWSLPVEGGRPQGAATLRKPDIGWVSSLGVTAAGALHMVKDASTRSLQVAPIDMEAGRLTGPPALESFRSEYPGWSRDGKYLGYSSVGTNDTRMLSIRSQESGSVRQVRPALLYFQTPHWLPDGRSVVTFGRDLKGRLGIYQIDVETGKTSMVADGDGGGQLSPDGTKVYYHVGRYVPSDRPAGFFERDLVSGETRQVFRQPAGGVLSPDGQFFAGVGRETGAWAIALRGIEGGESRTLLRITPSEPLDTFGSLIWTPDGRGLLVVRTTGDKTKELWLVPADGTPARKIDIDVSAWDTGGAGIRLSPTGRQITFFTGDSKREVWALESIVPLSASE